MDIKSQGQNERFELDMSWCGFRVNMSDEDPSTYVSLYDRREGRHALPTSLAMRWRKRWTDDRRGGGEGNKADLTIFQ